MSIKSIEYREIPANKPFYLLLAVLAAVVVLGAMAFFYMEHHGHYVSGMNNQIVWGLPHVFAIFLIVSASGVLNISAIGSVFGKFIYQPLGRFSALVAMSLLVGGLMILVLDLGRPDRLIIAMTHYNFKSIFAWNIILYNGFLVLSVLSIWTMMDRKMKPFYKVVGFAAFAWRLILTMGTGSIFGFLVARQYYDAAIMAPLFIAMSFALGLALFLLILLAAYRLTERELGDVVLNRLRYLLAVFIGAVLLLELARQLTNLYATEHHDVEAFMLWDGGIYTWMFWLGQIVLGSLLPLGLIFCRFLKNNSWAVIAAAALVVFGGLMQIYVVLIGGQAYPLVLFPGAEMQSAYFDGETYSYTPSVWEWMLGLGGVALALLFVTVGVKILRFMPVSLADELVDPHHLNCTRPNLI